MGTEATACGLSTFFKNPQRKVSFEFKFHKLIPDFSYAY
jgi:hypothetical protein